MKKIYATLILSFCIISLFSQFTWLAKDSLPGPPLYAASGFELNGSGYVIGGSTAPDNVTSTNAVWKYNPSTDQWTQKANFPVQTAGPAYFVLNNRAYVVGGNVPVTHYSTANYQYNETLDS